MSDENQCYRCHVRTKFLETFKTCTTCLKRYCSQCWIEFHRSDHRTRKKFCLTCLESMTKKSERKYSSNDDDFQLALALSLSEKETPREEKIDQEELLLKQITEAIERFFNRARSNCKLREKVFDDHLMSSPLDQRHRDITADTALLSAFIALQTCANDLDHLKDRLHQQRQYYEDLQEKLTSLRDAR